MANKKNRTTVKTINNVNTLTGEIESSHSININYDTEEDFNKIYIDKIHFLFKPTNSELSLFIKLLDFMDYNNKVYLNKENRGIIIDDLKIDKNTINHTLSRLIDKGMLFRTEINYYVVNALIASRGYWKDIKFVLRHFYYDEELQKWGYKPINKKRDFRSTIKDFIENK